MKAFETLVGRRCTAFHLRLAGCAGCAEVVEQWLRDRPRGDRTAAPLECASPRHCDLMLVTGAWSPGLAESALAVQAQAPESAGLVAVGDCALAAGLLGEILRDLEPISDHLDAEVEVPGCPVTLEGLEEALRDVCR